MKNINNIMYNSNGDKIIFINKIDDDKFLAKEVVEIEVKFNAGRDKEVKIKEFEKVFKFSSVGCSLFYRASDFKLGKTV